MTEMLEFYGVKVPYEGQTLGFYMPRNKSAASKLVPEFAECYIDKFIEFSKINTKDKFIDEITQIKKLAGEQSRGSIGSAAPIFTKSNLNPKEKEALKNTEKFFGEILTALSGK